jgi:hypothetical protein
MSACADCEVGRAAVASSLRGRASHRSRSPFPHIRAVFASAGAFFDLTPIALEVASYRLSRSFVRGRSAS